MSLLLGCGFAFAQVPAESKDCGALEPDQGLRQPTPSEQPTEPELLRTGRRPESHPFWNKSNVALFVGVGSARALDYASTRKLRARGLNEGLLTNAIVDNKPLFAGIEAAGVAASIGVCYWLHRRGHHKLEAWFSIAHITIGSLGAVRNYRIRSPAPNGPAP